VAGCENNITSLYECIDAYGCVEVSDNSVSSAQYFDDVSDCQNICDLKQNLQGARVTVFLYENCPIAQYMCGPLRNTYRYFCDTLDQDIVFRGFSPNSFSTESSLEIFQIEYDIPFMLLLDYDNIEQAPGLYTQLYSPVVTPEVFIELNGELVYRGMIDNSYQSLGQWTPPTENYLFAVLTSIMNNEEISYSETEAIGCFINY
tara:strand:+ start:96 stop:704 length:609 start_codon:yes stop_codon:yes gene_type:complete